MKNGFLLSILALFCLTACASVLAVASAKEPTTGPTEIVGNYSLGCIAGASTLQKSGTGYEVMRTSRNRFYGHPTLVQLLKQAGAEFGKTSPILYGDISQPRGGPMPSGHASHQIGLDADIWFYQLSDWEEHLRENLQMQSVVQPDGKAVDKSRWYDVYGEWIRWFANKSDVERIFVNPAIKKRLCLDYNEAKWLTKVRPWWGHDEHFHVRLKCPADQPKCRGQNPPDAVECGKELDDWFKPPPPPPPGPTPTPTPKPPLPEECKRIIGKGRR